MLTRCSSPHWNVTPVSGATLPQYAAIPLPRILPSRQEADPARAVCSAHNAGVVDMAALGDGLASVSAGMLRYHAVGGLPKATSPAPEAGSNAPLWLESRLTFSNLGLLAHGHKHRLARSCDYLYLAQACMSSIASLPGLRTIGAARRVQRCWRAAGNLTRTAKCRCYARMTPSPATTSPQREWLSKCVISVSVLPSVGHGPGSEDRNPGDITLLLRSSCEPVATSQFSTHRGLRLKALRVE